MPDTTQTVKCCSSNWQRYADTTQTAKCCSSNWQRYAAERWKKFAKRTAAAAAATGMTADQHLVCINDIRWETPERLLKQQSSWTSSDVTNQNNEQLTRLSRLWRRWCFSQLCLDTNHLFFLILRKFTAIHQQISCFCMKCWTRAHSHSKPHIQAAIISVAANIFQLIHITDGIPAMINSVQHTKQTWQGCRLTWPDYYHFEMPILLLLPQ